MTKRPTIALTGSAVAAVLLGSASWTWAQSYPTDTVTVVVHLSAGGGLDTTTRLIGDEMSEILGQPVIVENRTGAGGAIATEYVSHAEPDGYTLQMANNSSHTVNPALREDLAYDPIADFDCISWIGEATTVVVVPASLPVTTLEEFIAYAQERPGELNFGSGGTGSVTHLQGEQFNSATDLDLAHIPFPGAAPGLLSLIAGEVQLFMAGSGSVMAHVESGDVRPLAVTGQNRSTRLPDVPTLAELGVEGFDVGPWYALVGPDGLSEDVIATLNDAVLQALSNEELAQRFADLDITLAGTTPDECTAIMQNELEQWIALAEELGLSIE